MKILLVIPSKIGHDVDPKELADQRPTMDYYALATELKNRGASVDFLDSSMVAGTRLPMDLALAIAASKISKKYAAIYTNSESIAIPLALLFRAKTSRPRLVTIAHKLSSGKKKAFFRQLKVHREIDVLFVYCESQACLAIEKLGIPAKKIRVIAFQADFDFFRPLPSTQIIQGQFCSAGLEWRDYPTLVEAAQLLPECTFKIAAASPWSKKRNELQGRELPANVSSRVYDYAQPRQLYAESIATIVPLYESDFQAGVTTVLESMAMGRPVIASRTTGLKDLINEDETGFYVPPGNIPALTDTVSRINTMDERIRTKIGLHSRKWLIENAGLKKWASTIADELMNVG
jgi:glycosyltransferase involved in cell wall biosynthesis